MSHNLRHINLLIFSIYLDLLFLCSVVCVPLASVCVCVCVCEHIHICVCVCTHMGMWACKGMRACTLEMHIYIDTKSRIDIIAIFLFCIDIFNRYIGICKSFHQVINFSAQSQKCKCLHSHTMQADRQRERERDVHDFWVNPWNKNVYFVRMSVAYVIKLQKEAIKATPSIIMSSGQQLLNFQIKL